MKLLTITKNKKRLVNFKDYRGERKSHDVECECVIGMRCTSNISI